MSDDISNMPWWKTWLISARPKTLVAVITPLMISTAYLIDTMDNVIHAPYFLVQLTVVWVACILLQVACNLTNEYYDYIRGTDDDDRIGPRRMLQRGLITKEIMAKGIFIIYLSFFLISLILSLTLTWTIMPLALISMAAAFFYTGGKYPLSYYGLGDFFAFWFFGPALTLIIIYVSGYSHIRFEPFIAFNLGISPGLFSLALININNIRDMEHDREKGKRTAAQLWGKKISLLLLIVFYASAMLGPTGLAWYYDKSDYIVLSIFLLPVLLFTFKVLRAKGSDFNGLIGFTGGFYLLQTLFFSIVWLL